MTVSGIPGTGPITVLYPVPGFQTFTAVGVADGDVVSYGAGDGFDNGTYVTWEVGRGTYSGGVLTRSPLWSSDGGAAVNLTESAVVWITVLAEDLEVELGGNVAGVTSVSLPAMTIVGGSNVTLSGGANAITIDAGGNNTIGLYAVGNTTGGTSSGTLDARSVSFSGAGIVSVGGSGGGIVIDASQSVQTLGLSAFGHTTGTTDYLTVDARSVSFIGSGGVSIGFDGGAIEISAGAVPGGVGLSAVGNTAGSTSSMTQELDAQIFSGAGIASVGFSDGTVVVSASSAITRAFTAFGNTAGTTSSMAGPITFEGFSGAGIASVGFNAGVIVVDVAAGGGSATSMGLTAVGNTTGTTSSQTHALTGSTLSGAGIVSVGFNAGSAVISATQSAQTLGLFAVGNTAGSTTSETADARTVSFVGSGVASVGYSNGSIVINAPAAAATNPILSLFAVSNTTQSTTSGANAAGSMSFAGAGAVSVGISGSSIVISSPATVASGTVRNGFALGNTTGDTSSTTNTLSLFSISGAGGISLGYSTTAAGAGVLIISGDTGSGATSATSMGLSAVGNTTGTTSSMTHAITGQTLSGAGGVSVGFNAGSVVISGQTSATVMSFTAAGNTTAITSSMTHVITNQTMSGGGLVSVGVNAGAIVISADQTAPALNVYAVGNTTTSVSSGAIQAGSLSFDGAGAVSVGISGSSVVISAPAQSAAALNVYAVSNTTDSTTSSPIGAGSLSFAGAGLVSVGISGSSVVISAVGTQSAQTLGLFAVGNTAGSTTSETVDARTVSFAGSGVASVGFSGGSIVINAPAAAATNPLLSLYAVGNTTQSTTSGANAPGSMSFAGAGAVSVGLSGSSVVISAPIANAVTLSYWEPGPLVSTTSLPITVGTMQMAPLELPAALSFNQIRMMASRQLPAANFTVSSSSATSHSATASAGLTYSQTIAIYSQGGGTDSGTFYTLSSSLLTWGVTDFFTASHTIGSVSVTASRSFVWNRGLGTTSGTLTGTLSTAAANLVASAAIATAPAVAPFQTIHRSDFSFAGSLPPGQYVVGYLLNSASASAGATVAGFLTAVAGPVWNLTFMARILSSGTIGQLGVASTYSAPGIGNTSTAGSGLVTSLPWEGLTQAAAGAYGAAPFYYMGVLGS